MACKLNVCTNLINQLSICSEICHLIGFKLCHFLQVTSLTIKNLTPLPWRSNLHIFLSIFQLMVTRNILPVKYPTSWLVAVDVFWHRNKPFHFELYSSWAVLRLEAAVLCKIMACTSYWSSTLSHSKWLLNRMLIYLKIMKWIFPSCPLEFYYYYYYYHCY